MKFATSSYLSPQNEAETMEDHNEPSTSSAPAPLLPFFRPRSHSRGSLISTSTIRSLEPKPNPAVPPPEWSPEELEIFNRRSSSPLPDSCQVTSRDEEWSLESAAYRIFLEMMQEKKKTFRVRGLKPVPEGFFSGHLIKHKKKDKNEEDFVLESFGLDAVDEDEAAVALKKKWNVQNTYRELKKIVSEFFRKCCKVFLKNKCNEGECPLTCECQRVKSFLNKRYDFDAEEENKRKKKEDKSGE